MADHVRIPPPYRRPSETRKIRWKGQSIHITIGYRPDHITACEIFYNGGYRSGSDLEALMTDICIMLSITLQQHGVTPDNLTASMSETLNVVTNQQEPASVVGLMLTELARPPLWAGELAERLGKPVLVPTATAVPQQVDDEDDVKSLKTPHASLG
ncbi:MAG: hypothetical protein OXC62_06370 [Aestuariivita sp.]|nr:hypothetical protein [Aestuariivita sp.]